MSALSVFLVGALGAVVGAIAACLTILVVCRVVVRAMLREGGNVK